MADEDEAGRSGWPGSDAGRARPGWQQPPPSPPPTGAPPAWRPSPTPPAPPVAAPARRPRANVFGPDVLAGERLKLVVAVLIGLVSVTVAVLTFRAAILGENATDKDRQAVAERVIEQQSEANAETQLQAERAQFARYVATLAEADAHDAEAIARSDAGDAAGAGLADAAAVEARQAADQLEILIGFGAYVVEPDGGGRPSFDVERRGADLERQASIQNQVDSGQTRASALELRAESQRLVGWIVPLVGAVVLLTFAQISRRHAPRLVLATGAVVVWIGVTGIALLGGS